MPPKLPKTDKGARKNPPFGQFSIADRYPAARTSYCRVVVWHYNRQNFGKASNLRKTPESERTVFDVEQFTIEEEVRSLTTSKTLDNPSGTFNISLFPTQNWKQKISPGDWVAIYLFNRLETTKRGKVDNRNLIMLGNVDRIARNLERDEDSDKIKLKYDISGRNFGKVFEDINIWFDPYLQPDAFLDTLLQTAGLELTGNPTTQVNKLLEVFLGEGAEFGKESAIGQGASVRTEPLNQFRIPIAVAKLFGASETSFLLGGNFSQSILEVLRRRITEGLPGFRDRNVISAEDNGNLWDNLMNASNDLVNEIFLEEVRDKDGAAFPTIVLRPRPLQTPFFDDNFGKELPLKALLNEHYKILQDLSEESFVEISPGEVFLENLGRDDHSRFNMFWLTSTRNDDANKSIYSNLNSNGQIGNPFFIRESVNRSGLKKSSRQWEFDRVSSAAGRAADTETDLYKALMVQHYDQNYVNHLYDAGTIETAGVLEAELGKVLTILPDANSGGKKRIFYIQGYEHEWNFPNTWRTMFSVTHGQFKTADANIFIDASNDDKGTLDTAFDSTYIAKTKTDNKDRSSGGDR